MNNLKTKNIGLLALLLSFIYVGCQKKELDIEIVDEACNNVDLINPSYKWIVDPSPDDTLINTGQLEVKFTFDGEARCLDKVEFSAKAYDCNGSEITFGFNNALQKSDAKLIINGTNVTALFDFSFPSSTEANKLNHIILTMNTENDLGDESKELEIRINAKDNVVKPNTYSINDDVKTVNFINSTFNITLWDHAAEDGDIVSVYLNGEWLVENFSLLNAETVFTFSRSKLNLGTNHMVVFAQNEGSVGPNTASMKVNGDKVLGLKPGLHTGEAVQIKVN